MCFSANVSFGAGIVLATIGVTSVHKVQKANQIYFATIPLIFSIQQISEGFVWLSLTQLDFHFLQNPATYLFLFIAQVIWPIWVPFSIMKLEPFQSKRGLHVLFMSIGILIAFYLGFCLFVFPIEARITEFHITYIQNFPVKIKNIGELMYGMATIIPPFLSQIKKMWIVGTTIMASYILTAFFYQEFIVSIWCFFASIISVTVYFILKDSKRKNEGWNGYINPQNQINHHNNN